MTGGDEDKSPIVTNWGPVDGETFGDTVDRIAEFYDLSPREAREEIDRAIEEDELVEDTTGKFPRLKVPSDEHVEADENAGDEGVVGEEDAIACISDTLSWYHAKVDDTIDYEASEYATPRDYYHDRGWTDQTIDAKKLGYAPPRHSDRLLDYLLRKGHSRKAILATGLFRERDSGGLRPIWEGRYVFPYSDEDGKLVYAISRAGSPPDPRDWAGKWSEDDDPSKYHKIPTSREEVLVEEPIFGLESVESGTPVLITEGIADAITAHQEGYPCISPVTTQFAHADVDRLANKLETHGVEQAFVVQDAEPPSSDIVQTDDEEELNVNQYGPGVKGAVKTAHQLVERDIDARIGELPRPYNRKVDLDDYLVRWNGDLQPILASSIPPAQHPASETLRSSREDALQQGNDAPDGVASTKKTSALWDLDLTDIARVHEGYRGPNPLGHHGESEDYFTVSKHEGDLLGYDHKYKTAYNALTYLLCEAGERPGSHPGGRLSDREVWEAWRHAKERGYIAEDDKCPSRALKHLAITNDICSTDDIEEGWRLPDDAYETVLNIIEDEYGLAHGHPVGGEQVSTVPLGRIQNLSWEDARRYARKRGFEWPSTQEARKQLENAVVNTIANQDAKVIDAPTALGKSYTVATFPWLRHPDVTGDAPVVMVHGTKEARDEADEASARAGLKKKKILSRKEACPVASGDYDDEITMEGEPASGWLDRQCDRKGLPFSVAHANLEDNNDQDIDLPCCPEEDECPSRTQWRDAPWDSDAAGEVSDDEAVKYDIIHATHQMLYVPSMTSGTNIVIDELPDYSFRVADGDREGDISIDRIQNAVTAYLKEIDAPITNWESLITLLRTREDDAFEELWGSLADQYFELEEAIEERSPGLDWYIENADAHVLSRAIVECVIDALQDDKDRNGLRKGSTVHTLPRMDDKDAKVRVTLVIDDDNRIKRIRQTPALSGTRSIVGLDAYPSMPLWHLNAVEHIERDEVLDTDERRFWRLFERGLFAVQIGDATRPLSGSQAKEWFDTERLGILLEKLAEEGLRTGITTAQVEDELQGLFTDLGIYGAETMHFGEVRSRNDFGGEDAGFVNGCMDPGDEYILTVLAEYDCEAEPETTTDEDGNEHRAHGRGFVGPDADVAESILASVRENEVAQAAGRYARNPDSPGDRAVVYIRTDATPTGFADVQVGGVKWMATEKQARIVESLQGREWQTAREIAEELDITKRHVLKTLKRLRDELGVVDCKPGEGAYGADLYRAITGKTKPHMADLGPNLNQDCELDEWIWTLIMRDADPVRQDVTYNSAEAGEVTATINSRFAPSPPEPSEAVEGGIVPGLDGNWIISSGEPA